MRIIFMPGLETFTMTTWNYDHTYLINEAVLMRKQSSGLLFVLRYKYEQHSKSVTQQTRNTKSVVGNFVI
ncbi:hypothetical protein H1D32_20955 [Anaerobacillus sp. CMMVII]|uniref:hypothetical protein n=1 Tax=Anaerobacillus sp. CMMVII TaxID=2755588 RepID=UPI0021B78436|nr:hypothetical protein [Anaerobacillus sp. CMMVII]MCT8139948.1 hypothetical protein [Anaerobacillus sp. CMMVII]